MSVITGIPGIYFGFIWYFPVSGLVCRLRVR